VRNEKYLEQFDKRNLVGIECTLYGFRMAGIAAANFFVARTGGMAADITGNNLLDTDQLRENGLGAPKATARENCYLLVHCLPAFVNEVSV
jgi:hypothetical protein